jgi:hypothetical protein
VAEASSVIQRMQKALTEMNVQLSNVLSDLSGRSGMKIIGAILEGERDPWKLAALVEPEVKATPRRILLRVGGCVKNVPRHDAVSKMKEGPSKSACRSRFQTAVSCWSRKAAGGERLRKRCGNDCIR